MLACPNCAVGREARAEFWSERPEYYGPVLLLPFLIVLAASRVLGRLGWFEVRR